MFATLACRKNIQINSPTLQTSQCIPVSFRRIDGLLGDSYSCRVPVFLSLYRLGHQETGLADSFLIGRFRVNRPNVYNNISSYARSSSKEKQKAVKIYLYILDH